MSGAEATEPPLDNTNDVAGRLASAVENEDVDDVRRLLLLPGANAAGTLSETSETTLLQAAMKTRNVDVMTLLLKAGASVRLVGYNNNDNDNNNNGRRQQQQQQQFPTLLHWAIVNESEGGGGVAQEPNVLALLQAITASGVGATASGLDIQNALGNTPLFLACRRGRATIARALVQAGANIRLPDTHTRTTPLHAAIVPRGNIEIVRMLLEQQQEPDTNSADDLLQARTSTGKTPLHVAIEYAHSPIVSLLLQKQQQHCPAGNSNNNLLDTLRIGNRTPLGSAIARRDLVLMKTLKEHGANVNLLMPPAGAAAAGANLTYLHQAVQDDNLWAVQGLLRIGADATVRTTAGPDGSGGGKTALDLACELDRSITLVYLLLKNGVGDGSITSSSSRLPRHHGN